MRNVYRHSFCLFSRMILRYVKCYLQIAACSLVHYGASYKGNLAGTKSHIHTKRDPYQMVSLGLLQLVHQVDSLSYAIL